MHNTSPTDPGRTIDWGKTSGDYSVFRPGPPDSFYRRLQAFGVGLPGQEILDLGTGTGVLARRFASAGAHVCGIDASANQIAAAKELAAQQGVNIDFQVAPAEKVPFENGRFDVITANQCWLYFDKPRAIAEVKRLLKPDGVLSVSHFSWLPRLDPVARQSEELVLKFNPQWTAADWSGEVPFYPSWAQRDFDFAAAFIFDEAIPFTHESWRGRMRACRGVGATLSSEECSRFDQAHAEWLQRIVPDPFTVLHRLDAVILRPKSKE